MRFYVVSAAEYIEFNVCGYVVADFNRKVSNVFCRVGFGNRRNVRLHFGVFYGKRNAFAYRGFGKRYGYFIVRDTRGKRYVAEPEDPAVDGKRYNSALIVIGEFLYEFAVCDRLEIGFYYILNDSDDFVEVIVISLQRRRVERFLFVFPALFREIYCEFISVYFSIKRLAVHDNIGCHHCVSVERKHGVRGHVEVFVDPDVSVYRICVVAESEFKSVYAYGIAAVVFNKRNDCRHCSFGKPHEIDGVFFVRRYEFVIARALDYGFNVAVTYGERLYSAVNAYADDKILAVFAEVYIETIAVFCLLYFGRRDFGDDGREIYIFYIGQLCRQIGKFVTEIRLDDVDEIAYSAERQNRIQRSVSKFYIVFVCRKRDGFTEKVGNIDRCEFFVKVRLYICDDVRSAEIKSRIYFKRHSAVGDEFFYFGQYIRIIGKIGRQRQFGFGKRNFCGKNIADRRVCPGEIISVFVSRAVYFNVDGGVAEIYRDGNFTRAVAFGKRHRRHYAARKVVTVFAVAFRGVAAIAAEQFFKVGYGKFYFEFVVRKTYRPVVIRYKEFIADLSRER